VEIRKSPAQSDTRIKLVKRVTIFFAGVTLIASILVPWLLVRWAARTSVEELVADDLTGRLKNLVFAIENVLAQYEAVSEFLASSRTNPDLIRCAPHTITSFIKYARGVHEHLSRSPNRYSLAEFPNRSQQYCQMDIASADEFTLYYLWAEGDRMLGRRYNSSVNFHDWDYRRTGTHVMNVSFIPGLPVWDDVANSTFWTHQMAVSGSELMNEAEMNALTPIFVRGRVIGMSGISISFDTLLKVVTRALGDDVIRYAVTRADGGVILEQSRGVVPPQDRRAPAVYPMLDALNDTQWSAVKHALANVSEDRPTGLRIEEEAFLSAWKAVVPRKRHQTHAVFVLLSLDQAITRCYAPTSLIFALDVVLVMAGVFVIVKLLAVNNARRVRRLAKQCQRSAPAAPKKIVGEGLLSRAVQRIRQLQIAYAEDIALNKELDVVVQNLTQSRARSFAIGNGNCDFCSELNPPEPVWPPSRGAEPFKAWRATTFPRFRMGLPLSSRYPEFSEPPRTVVAKLFVSIVEGCGLLFPEFDPDLVASWCLDLSHHREMDCVATARLLYAVYNLLNRPFKHWLTVKYELFALYCAALVHGVQVQCEFPDPELVIEEKTVTLVDRLAGHATDLTRVWFVRIVRELLRALDPARQFELLGEARVRFQSPDFSIVGDFADRLLFTKAILRLSAWSEYWDADEVVLPERPLDVKVRIEVAEKVVSPWIQLFAQFQPLDDLTAGVEHTLQLMGVEPPVVARGMPT
jgi:hypothetical protein